MICLFLFCFLLSSRIRPSDKYSSRLIGAIKNLTIHRIDLGRDLHKTDNQRNWQTSMPRVGFELTIAAFEPANALLALLRSVIAICVVSDTFKSSHFNGTLSSTGAMLNNEATMRMEAVLT
jgi:hypothetical protein